MELTLKDKDFLERLRRLMNSRELSIELKQDGVKRSTLPKGGSVMTWVDSKISAGIGVLTLNNPKKLNPLSKELIDDLCAALEDKPS